MSAEKKKVVMSEGGAPKVVTEVDLEDLVYDTAKRAAEESTQVVTESLETMITNQEQISETVEKIHDSIFDLDHGLYVRVKNVENNFISLQKTKTDKTDCRLQEKDVDNRISDVESFQSNGKKTLWIIGGAALTAVTLAVLGIVFGPVTAVAAVLI